MRDSTSFSRSLLQPVKAYGAEMLHGLSPGTQPDHACMQTLLIAALKCLLTYMAAIRIDFVGNFRKCHRGTNFCCP